MTRPSELLSPKSSQVEELFNSSYFEIPRNQRSYRWGEDPKNDQREKLWDDLLMTVKFDCNPKNTQKMGHFLGQIVVIGQEQSLDSKRLQVIDGQQRLTTITILCATLREFTEKIEDKRTRRNMDFLLTPCVVSPGSDNAPRVVLNRDNLFYQSLIVRETQAERINYWNQNYDSSRRVQKNIKSAFELFYNKIASYLDEVNGAEDKERALVDLVEVLTKNLYFLVVRAENYGMVYRLFETLNERGLDLSQADLIKNVLLESARAQGEREESYVHEGWEAFVDNYESQPDEKLDLPHLIQFSYTYRHELVQKEQIFQKISTNLRKDNVDASSLVLEFEADSDNWNKFLLGDLTSWSEEQADAQFAIIDPLWKKHCVPYLIAIMDKFSENKDILLKLTQLCENYLFRQGFIYWDGVTKLQSVFSKAAGLVRGDAKPEEIAEYFRENSSDQLFVESFKTASVNTMKQGFYVIWKIENYLLDRGLDFKPKSQSPIQHLEHILPRKPGEEWGEIEQRDEFKAYVNRLGNLMVLEAKINQHVKNKSIEYKLKNEAGLDYHSSKLNLPHELTANYQVWAPGGDWSFESISKRQETMALKYATAVWPLEFN